MLQNNDIEMYSTHKDLKSVIAEMFVRTLKKKYYRYVTSILKNMFIDKLDYIINDYNNKYHRIIKMKPTDANSSMHIDFAVENNEKGPKFEVETIKILFRGHA